MWVRLLPESPGKKSQKSCKKKQRLHSKKFIDYNNKAKEWCMLALINWYKTESNRFFIAYIADI